MLCRMCSLQPLSSAEGLKGGGNGHGSERTPGFGRRPEGPQKGSFFSLPSVPRVRSLFSVPSLRTTSIHGQGRTKEASVEERDALSARHDIFPTPQGDLNHDHL